MNQLTLFHGVTHVAPHPAQYTPILLPLMAEFLRDCFYVLDPFGGVGGVFQLKVYLPFTDFEAVEIEPEWAAQDPRITLGNAPGLPWEDGTFDGICTSPTYGNRMADHHDAKDDSRRITYRHYLGRPLDPDNSGQLQWGPKYRAFHEQAWAEAVRVLRPGGTFVLNVKNHVRAGEVQDVVSFHFGVLYELGLVWKKWRNVPVRGMGFGQNRDVRVDHEIVAAFGKVEQ